MLYEVITNTERLNIFTQLDIRVDKSYYFNKWSLMLYLDIQNITNSKTDTRITSYNVCYTKLLRLLRQGMVV